MRLKGHASLPRVKNMTHRMHVRSLSLALVAVSGAWMLGGCKSHLDQSELVRHEGDRLVVPILDSIDPIDEGDPEFTNASDVKQDDLKVIVSDYRVGPNDFLSISVLDPLAGGLETVRSARVSETGMLSLPNLPEPIRVSGLTELELQRAIIARYREAGIIQSAQVTVTVVEARQRTFSVTGAIARPGQYVILESDFRLLNALVQAGDTTQPTEYLYVIRKLASERPSTQPGTTIPAGGETGPPVDPLAPRSEAPAPTPAVAPVTERPVLAAFQDAPREQERTVIIDGKPVTIGGAGQPPAGADAAADAPTTRPAVGPDAAVPADDQAAFEFGSALVADEETRIIRVPLQQLKNGDLRYNIVIRPQDLIMIPPPQVGFYYMGGHVGQPGVFSLTGQKVNLKQAVIAARMLDGFAVPQKTDIIRRVGGSELYLRVNLERIFAGKESDIYLKPNDIVQVGTDFWPPYLAALRGAFRFSYGLGFLYDRNFAPQQDQDIN